VDSKTKKVLESKISLVGKLLIVQNFIKIWRKEMFKTKSILKIMGVIICILLIFSMSSFGAKRAAISMVTGGTSGTYFPIGGAICEIINEALPDIGVTVLTGNGSVANINLIWQHEIESGLAQNNLVDWAYNSVNLYEGKEPVKNLRAIASLWPEHVQIAAQKYAKIKSIQDIKGKKISVGNPGSGGEADAILILGLLGISFSDFEPLNLDQGTSADYMKDKLIDALFVTSAFPIPSIVDMSQKRDITLVEFTEEEIAKIHEKYPYYTKAVVPGGSYRGVDEDVNTIAVQALWVVDEEVDEEIIYQVTKALWNDANLERIQLAHARAKSITLETALDGISIPLHPGAEKFYKEAGMIK